MVPRPLCSGHRRFHGLGYFLLISGEILSWFLLAYSRWPHIADMKELPISVSDTIHSPGDWPVFTASTCEPNSCTHHRTALPL